ncbi:MAG: hypothetical protein ACREEM_38115, partial [Blastocatellia bacterium]
MKAQHIRPKVQNGPITRRASSHKAPSIKATKSAQQAKRSAGTSAGVFRGEAERREPDSRVFWTMVFAGAVLTAGFVLGLRMQINAHQLNRAEEKLKDELDRYVSQQKFLSLQQQRARSPRESERAVKEAGLLQLKLDQQNSLPAKPAEPAETARSKAGAVAAKTSTARSAAAPAIRDRQAMSVKTRKELTAKTVAGKPVARKQSSLPKKKSGEKKLAVKKPAEKKATVKA